MKTQIIIVTLVLLAVSMVAMPSIFAKQEQEKQKNVAEKEIIFVHEKEQLYNVPLEDDLQRHIIKKAEEYDIEPTLIFAVITIESGYKTDIVGDNGESFGLMQVQPKWHRERMKRLGVTDLTDAYQNVLVGIDILAEKMNENLGIEWALMAYNGGNSYANKMTANGEVSEYVNKVALATLKIEKED